MRIPQIVPSPKRKTGLETFSPRQFWGSGAAAGIRTLLSAPPLPDSEPASGRAFVVGPVGYGPLIMVGPIRPVS